MASCERCERPISAARLRAVPDATLCTECQAKNDVPLVRGYMSWAHKTAPEIIIGPEADILRSYDRKGVHAQLPLNSLNNPRLIASATARQDSSIIANYVRGREATCVRGSVKVQRARCHPDRPKVTPDGKCVECAVDWYRKHRR